MLLLFWHRVRYELTILNLHKEEAVVLEDEGKLPLLFLNVEQFLPLNTIEFDHFSYNALLDLFRFTHSASIIGLSNFEARAR
jgi:hypothetical protein